MAAVIRKHQDVDGVTHESVVGSARTKCGRRHREIDIGGQPKMLAASDDASVDCIDCIAAGDRPYRPTISPSDMPNMQQIPRSKK